MNVKLLPLLGLSKKEYDSELKDCVCEENSEITGYNQAISELESKLKSLEEMEEALAKILWEYDRKGKNPSNEQVKEFIPLAKAILSNLPSILVRKE